MVTQKPDIVEQERGEGQTMPFIQQHAQDPDWIVKKRDPSAQGDRQTEVTCEQCGFYGFLPLFKQLPLEMEHLFLFRQQPVPKGETLFREGQPFHGIYAVKEGGIKSYSLTPSQEERVLGFYLPGELLGLESIRASHYSSTAVALEPCRVCWLPLDRLELLGDRFPPFQEELIQILTTHLTQQQQQFVLSARQSAEGRLAAFLINIAERYAQRGLPGQTFRLTMLRQDIANFLGLSMETVSRTLRRLQEERLVYVVGKQIQILDLPGLQAAAQCPLTGELT